MDKRYQVFVSSTFRDLAEERRHVIQTLMEMDCIPAGMELFPAMDEEQWAFIKRVIDDCDYYIVIIGWKYGSTTPQGVSYTEQEFDYAVSKGLKVIALIHGDQNTIPASKIEMDSEARERLLRFREKSATGRLVRYWTDAKELPGLVATSLQKTIKTYPAVGWVRGDQIANIDALAQVNALRGENERLKAELAERIAAQELQNESAKLADGSQKIELHGKTRHRDRYGIVSRQSWTANLTWDDVLRLIGPSLLEHRTKPLAKSKFEAALRERFHPPGHGLDLSEFDFDTILLQLHGLGYLAMKELATTGGDQALFLRLTPKGTERLTQLRVIPLAQ